MANSMNSTPRHFALGGIAATGITAAFAVRANSSSKLISERRPSTATLRAEPARNWSLKISSEMKP